MCGDSSHDAEHFNNLRTVYTQVCTSVRSIDDFRAKLLGFLPLASGVGIFALLGTVLPPATGDPATRSLLDQFLFPIGAFGFAVTFGLYLYEIRGIQYCTHLIGTAEDLEVDLKIRGGFLSRPQNKLGGFVSEIAAAHVIYAAVLAAWAFVMAILPPGRVTPAIVPATLVALGVFVVVVVGASRFELDPPRERGASRARNDMSAFPAEARTTPQRQA